MVHVRPAAAEDAEAMSAILADIQKTWKTRWTSTPEYILTNYIDHPEQVRCSVATDPASRVLGFQSLKCVGEGNPFQVAAGWGVIGTFVRLNAIGQGTGRALFAATLEAARRAGVTTIDATIEPDNALGLAYYRAMGFRAYRTLRSGAIGTRLTVGVDAPEPGQDRLADT